MSKKTYDQIGPESWYQYEPNDTDDYKKVIISDTISSLNVVNGDNNDIRNVIYKVDNIGSNVKELQASCFYECPNLKSVNIPPTLQKIKNDVFKNCNSLDTFENDVFNVPRYVGTSTFNNCDLKKVNLKSNLLEISKITDDDIINDDSDDSNDNNNFNVFEMGERTFANNTNLTDISMDNIIFSQNMFENCSSLSSVTISDNAIPIITGKQTFNNCNNLSSLRLSEKLTDYYQLHGETLKGSSILSVYVPGMLSSQVDFVTGKINGTFVKPGAPTDYNNIKLGTIYKFTKSSSTLENLKLEIGNLMTNVMNGHIPVIIMFCNDQCGVCTDFKQNILNNYQFCEWFKNKKCILIYCETIIEDDTTNWSSKTWNRCFEFNFKYTDINNIEKPYTTESDKRYLDRNFIHSYGVGTFSETAPAGITYTVSSIFKISARNQNITMYSYNIGDDPSAPSGRKDLYSYVAENFNNFDWQVTNFFNTTLFDNCTICSEDGMLPSVTLFWRQDNDATFSNMWIKLSEEQKQKFLRGELFEIEYEHREKTFNIRFTPLNAPLSNKSDGKIQFIINDKIVVYQVDSINASGDRRSYNAKVAIDSNNIYVSASKSSNSYIPRDIKVDCRSVEGFKETIDYFCKDYMRCEDIDYVQQNTDTIEYEQVTGKCWGVEHDCVVIGKDGYTQTFYYDPPEES